MKKTISIIITAFGLFYTVRCWVGREDPFYVGMFIMIAVMGGELMKKAFKKETV